MLFTYIPRFLIFCHICFKSLIFFFLCVKPFENELQISCSFIPKYFSIHFPGPRTSLMPLQYHYKIQETGHGHSTIISSTTHRHILLILPRVSFIAFPRQCWFPSKTTHLSCSPLSPHSPFIQSDCSVFALSFTTGLDQILPEAEAETGIQMQVDIQEAILGSMIRECGSGTRKGRKPM